MTFIGREDGKRLLTVRSVKLSLYNKTNASSGLGGKAGHVESTATRRWVGYATLLRCFAAVRTASLADCHAMIAALDPT